MADQGIQDYFLQQVKMLVMQSASEPDGFADYFVGREPKDEEVLGFIAVTTLLSCKYHLAERFPTPAEALAALPAAARSEICNEFRQKLRGSQRLLSSV